LEKTKKLNVRGAGNGKKKQRALRSYDLVKARRRAVRHGVRPGEIRENEKKTAQRLSLRRTDVNPEVSAGDAAEPRIQKGHENSSAWSVRGTACGGVHRHIGGEGRPARAISIELSKNSHALTARLRAEDYSGKKPKFSSLQQTI